jgi:hypothetical protein
LELTVSEELTASFAKADVVQIPWLMFGFRITKPPPNSPRRDLVYRKNLDKRHRAVFEDVASDGMHKAQEHDQFLLSKPVFRPHRGQVYQVHSVSLVEDGVAYSFLGAQVAIKNPALDLGKPTKTVSKRPSSNKRVARPRLTKIPKFVGMGMGMGIGIGMGMDMGMGMGTGTESSNQGGMNHTKQMQPPHSNMRIYKVTEATIAQALLVTSHYRFHDKGTIARKCSRKDDHTTGYQSIGKKIGSRRVKLCNQALWRTNHPEKLDTTLRDKAALRSAAACHRQNLTDADLTGTPLTTSGICNTGPPSWATEFVATHNLSSHSSLAYMNWTYTLPNPLLLPRVPLLTRIANTIRKSRIFCVVGSIGLVLCFAVTCVQMKELLGDY